MTRVAVRSFAVSSALAIIAASAAAPPQYQIYDIGVVQTGDTVSQGFRVSPNGIAVGRSVRSGASQAFTWTVGGGIVGLPNLAGRAYAVSNAANDNGLTVGTAASSLNGNARLPVFWSGGIVTQFALPSGQTLGDANDVNAAGVAVGSVNSGSLQRGTVYQGGAGAIITQTSANGSYFLTAFGINNNGLVCGQGIDPNNAAVNVGILYDMNTNQVFDVGATAGNNGALAFDVSNAGHVTGSSMFNQGSGTPFIWQAGSGIQAVPLPVGTSQGSGRGVNSSGWVVGTASSAFAIPFVYDGTATYRIGDVIVNPSGWDLLTNTSSSALGISDTGVIVGTGLLNGSIHGYALVPVPEPTSLIAIGLGLAATRRRRR